LTAQITRGRRAVTALERRVLDLVLDRNAPERSASNAGLRGKFVMFCVQEDRPARRTIPLFPVSLSKLLSYGLWLSDNGVNGWSSVKNYLAACVGWAAERSCSDCRDTTPVHAQLYARFRQRFQADVPVKRRRKSKMDMRPELMEAMALQTTDSDVSIGQMSCYLVLYLSSIRVGHVAPASLDRSKHVLTWGDVILTEFDVFLYLRSTKTRRVSSDDGWWTVLAARPHGHFCLDPVRMLQLWRSRAYVCDTQPVFGATTAPMLAITRPQFTTALRARLRRAVSILPRGHLCSIDRLSGISFSKAGLTQLWDKVPRHRLQAHAGHASFASTAAYGGDTFLVRRSNTTEIAKGFTAGF
jgi:hypothetical protein